MKLTINNNNLFGISLYPYIILLTLFNSIPNSSACLISTSAWLGSAPNKTAIDLANVKYGSVICAFPSVG